MKLVIYKTHKRVLIATSTFTISSVSEYIKKLSLFGIQIDELDAAKDLVEGKSVELTVPVDYDYALDA